MRSEKMVERKEEIYIGYRMPTNNSTQVAGQKDIIGLVAGWPLHRVIITISVKKHVEPSFWKEAASVKS